MLYGSDTDLIFIGVRDEKLMINEGDLKEFNLDGLVNYGLSESKNCKKFWSSTKCFNFLNRFLDFVKEVVKEENVIFEFYKIDKGINFKSGRSQIGKNKKDIASCGGC